jgi:hypothetical protein
MFDQVRRLTAVSLHCRNDELAARHTGKASLRHQPRDALATDTNALGRQLGMNARRTAGAAGGRMCGIDLSEQHRIRLCPPRRLPLHPRIVATGGDTQ